MTHSPLAWGQALAHLQALGRSVGSTALAGPSGLAWVVTGHRRHGEDT